MPARSLSLNRFRFRTSGPMRTALPRAGAGRKIGRTEPGSPVRCAVSAATIERGGRGEPRPPSCVLKGWIPIPVVDYQPTAAPSFRSVSVPAR